MRRVLLDTNVLVSAVIKPEGKPAQIFQQASQRYELLCTEHILQELAGVLTRKHIQTKYRDLVAPERRQAFLELVRGLAQFVEVQTSLEVVADPQDNQVLAGASDGGANYLVTGDPHLLRLGAFGHTQIVTPNQFLRVLAEEE